MAKLDTMCVDMGKAAGIERKSGESLTDWANRIKNAVGRGSTVPMSDIYREWKAGSLKMPDGSKPAPTTAPASTQSVSQYRQATSVQHTPGNPVQVVVNAAPVTEKHELRTVDTWITYARQIGAWCQTFALGLMAGIILTKMVLH